MPRSQHWPALAMAAAMLVLGACTPSPPQPEEPVWGKQPCGHCAMVVGDPAHAAQLLTADGDRLFFDDIGCMVQWELQHPPPAGHWVHQAGQPPWVAAEQARYRSDAKTPMDFGLEAAPSGIDYAAATAQVRARQRGGQ